MSTYAIGDIQGSWEPLQQLLELTGFNPASDRLWLAGDLVNRGPGSLEVLRWAVRHQHCLSVVLGNHDLHLLAVAAGHAKLQKEDTLDAVLAAEDSQELLDWLRQQRLFHVDQGVAMVHAGLLPDWTIATARRLAAEVEAVLQGPHHDEFFAQMYGNKPTRWHDSLQGWDRLRLIVNSMTRMRLVNRNGQMDLKFKGELNKAPAELLAWFDHPDRRSADTPIVCGHWSALGLHLQDNLMALDTGCLWGGSLTALRLEDRKLFQVSCAHAPGVRAIW